MPELLADDALIQAVAGIKQHVHSDGVIHVDVHRAHRAHLVVIGDRRDGAFSRLEHFDADAGAVG